MRKILILLVFGVSVISKAQVNGGFEKWKSIGTAQDPEGWISLNAALPIGLIDSAACFRSTNACNSEFSARIRSITSKNNGNTDTIAGLLATKQAFSGRPLTLRYCYAYSCQTPDTATIRVELYKGYTKNPSNMIGYCDAILSAGKSWVSSASPINWSSVSAADTVIIIIMSGHDGKVNELLIDNVSLSDFGAGITDVQALDAKVFSTPGKTIQVNLNQAAENTQFRLFDLNGKLVYASSLGLPQTSISLPNLNAGLYIYQLLDNRGTICLKSGKLSIE